MKTQYVTDSKGKKIAVILPMQDYEKLREEADEYNCINVYDKAKARKDEFFLAEEAFTAIEKKRKRA